MNTTSLDLRPFLYDERTLTPLQVATADTLDEFIVEKVLSMEGDPHKPRKFLRFRIRWAGYGPDDDTWEPWENVKDSDAVQLFLIQQSNKRVRRMVQKGYVLPHLRKDVEGIDEEESSS